MQENKNDFVNSLEVSRTVNHRIEARVVGIKYGVGYDFVDTLSIGEEVYLVCAPNNIYDKNSIKIITVNRQLLGFLRKEVSAKLAAKFDAYGKPVRGVVAARHRWLLFVEFVLP